MTQDVAVATRAPIRPATLPRERSGGRCGRALNLSGLTLAPGVQLKARSVDERVVRSFADALESGSVFPPVVAFDDGETLWLADGFHRVAALRLLGRSEIEADVRSGGRQEASVHAALANVTGGRLMSRAEKREAGERLIKSTDWSDREIERRLALGRGTATKWRQSLSGEISPDTTRTVTRNGRTYQMDVSGIGRRQEGEVDADLVLPDQARLICGDFAQVGPTLDEGSFDVILTDPPYPREYLGLYGLLAQQAARLLRPGGSLLAMAGQSYLPEIFALMTPHLRYHWTVAYLTPGGQAVQLWQRNVNTFWKPVLWFVKGKYQGKWAGDVARSAANDNDKRFHHWGQSESGLADLVERFSQPGDVVLDPFCGGGTTGEVAVALSRRFVGVDVSEVAIETSRRRLASGG